MTIFLLIRHGENDLLGRNVLAGRRSGIHLNEQGRRQAGHLTERLSKLPVKAIYSSPLERAVETAEPLSRRIDKPISIIDGIVEMEFGEWTGRSFDELYQDPQWREFNSFRSSTRIPQGEISIAVQSRMVQAMEALRKKHPDQLIALFSHGDPIRTAIAHFLGMPLDFILRLRISPASISAIKFASWGAEVLFINDTEGLQPLSDYAEKGDR